MRVFLVYRHDPEGTTDAVSSYVTRLLPALAQDHATAAVSVEPGPAGLVRAAVALRQGILTAHPQIIHLNNLRGPALATVLWAIDRQIPVAVSLFNQSLLGRFAAANRQLTSDVGLVISPSHYLLDRHRERGFFPRAIQVILPYGIEPVPPPPPRPFSDAFDVLDFSGSLTLESRRTRLRAADCVVIRRTAEENDFLVLQEAFQAGAVVILSRTGGASEMIRDGVNGLLVEPGDEAGIAAAIDRLRRSPELAARLRASALETARLYDMRFHIAHLTAAYRQLLNASRAGDLDRPAA
jgi:hypothetical protein